MLFNEFTDLAAYFHSRLQTTRDLAESRLRITEGLGYSAEVDPTVSEFVIRCKENRKVREYLQELANATKQDKNRIAPDFLKVVRRLIELGFLLLVDEQ